MMSAFSVPTQAPEAPPLTLDCPICQRSDLEAGTELCPNCGTGLGALWRLRELPSQYYNAGLAAARTGDLDAALSKFSCAMELGGEDPALHVLLGKLCWQLGERSRALWHWHRVQEQDPANAECRGLLRMASLRRARRGALFALLFALLLAGAGSGAWWLQSARDATNASSGICAIVGPRPMSISPAPEPTASAEESRSSVPVLGGPAPVQPPSL